MTGRAGLRKRKQPTASPLKRKRKMPRRRAKQSENMGVCEINGTAACDSEKKVKLVKFDGCNCKRLCMPCARAWLKNSSTCPFCRAQVSLVNNIDVEYKRQREDHDVEQPCFSFPYTDWLGNTAVFQASIETSRLFANKRAKYKLPKEILFAVKVIESLDIEIVHDNAFYTFVVRKLFNYRGKKAGPLPYSLLLCNARKESSCLLFPDDSLAQDDSTEADNCPEYLLRHAGRFRLGNQQGHLPRCPRRVPLPLFGAGPLQKKHGDAPLAPAPAPALPALPTALARASDWLY